MSRSAGGVPWSWKAAVLSAGAVIATASALITYYLASPVLNLSDVIIGFLVLGLYAVPIGAWWIIRSSGRVGMLVLLLLSLPLGRLTVEGLEPVVSPVTALVALCTVAWLWRVLAHQDKIELSWIQLPLAVFLLSSLVSLYSAQDTAVAIKQLGAFAMGAAVFMVTSQTVYSSEQARTIMSAATATVGFIALQAIVGDVVLRPPNEVPTGTGMLDQLTVGGESYGRAEGILTSPNLLGGFLALSIPPSIVLLTLEPVWWRRTLGYLMIAVAIVALALTYSRGAWIGMGAGLLALFLMYRRSFWLSLKVALYVLPGVALAGAVTSSETFLMRMQSIAIVSSESSLRFEVWKVGLRLVAENPFFGVGLANFKAAYADLTLNGLPRIPSSEFCPPNTWTLPDEAHNLFIQLAVDIGVVGCVAFVLMLAIAFLRVVRVNRTANQQTKILSLGIIAGLVAVLVHNVLDVTVYQGFSVILLFVYLGILDAMGRFNSVLGSRNVGKPS